MEPQSKSKGKRKSLVRTLSEWLTIGIIAFLLALVVRAFVFQSYYIPSGSMLPTLQIGDRILVDKLSYDLHSIHEGDIVVFRKPTSDTDSAGITDLVKRVIGLPGQKISEVNGQVYINGKLLKEPFLPKSALTFHLATQTVPKGDVFVMGDNRMNSKDSRYFGPISEKLIVGKVVMIFWPPSQFKLYF
ncbi:signal peptidase I [Ferrithrix thermotolerans DSM 19514]|uniref:Signal peptidase I n=1 Tax=Ferrithrix thermotolerans DSM 19514 TaxID=1121881 RepID=A0A1M4XFF9_9ACTN|nr:signal peptidase I [Ferrithrix thermotolerans]SHE92255.1 signal peptidase I [Ferrithrix thermotolerans DSM 19514]